MKETNSGIYIVKCSLQLVSINLSLIKSWKVGMIQMRRKNHVYYNLQQYKV